MDIRKEIRKLSPFSSGGGCYHLFVAAIAAAIVEIGMPLAIGDFEGKDIWLRLLAFLGAYWISVTVLFALFAVCDYRRQ
jgi:hypothetical protein